VIFSQLKAPFFPHPLPLCDSWIPRPFFSRGRIKLTFRPQSSIAVFSSSPFNSFNAGVSPPRVVNRFVSYSTLGTMLLRLCFCFVRPLPFFFHPCSFAKPPLGGWHYATCLRSAAPCLSLKTITSRAGSSFPTCADCLNSFSFLSPSDVRWRPPSSFWRGALSYFPLQAPILQGAVFSP